MDLLLSTLSFHIYFSTK